RNPRRHRQVRVYAAEPAVLVFEDQSRSSLAIVPACALRLPLGAPQSDDGQDLWVGLAEQDMGFLEGEIGNGWPDRTPLQRFKFIEPVQELGESSKRDYILREERPRSCEVLRVDQLFPLSKPLQGRGLHNSIRAILHDASLCVFSTNALATISKASYCSMNIRLAIWLARATPLTVALPKPSLSFSPIFEEKCQVLPPGLHSST